MVAGWILSDSGVDTPEWRGGYSLVAGWILFGSGVELFGSGVDTLW